MGRQQRRFAERLKAKLGKDALIKGSMQRLMDNGRGKPGGITVLCGQNYHLACDALGFRAATETELEYESQGSSLPRQACLCHHHTDNDYSDDETNGPKADAEAEKGKKIGDMLLAGKRPKEG